MKTSTFYEILLLHFGQLLNFGFLAQSEQQQRCRQGINKTLTSPTKHMQHSTAFSDFSEIFELLKFMFCENKWL